MLDIYKYREFHKFLTDAFREKRSRNRAFSMTAWAHQMGLENSSPLSLAFKGKRVLPKKYLPEIIRTLDLDSNQAQYLESLLELARAKTPEQKLLYNNRLNELSPGEFGPQIVEEFKYLSNPLDGAILEMTELREFIPDGEWIQSRLHLDVTLADVREAIDRLLQLGLMNRGDDGRMRKAHQSLTTPQDVADLGTKTYHKKVSEMAGDAVFQQSLSQREFNSYSLNLKKEQLPKAKKAIRQFVTDFIAEFEAQSGDGDDTYQINLQLFKITK